MLTFWFWQNENSDVSSRKMKNKFSKKKSVVQKNVDSILVFYDEKKLRKPDNISYYRTVVPVCRKVKKLQQEEPFESWKRKCRDELHTEIVRQLWFIDNEISSRE